MYMFENNVRLIFGSTAVGILVFRDTAWLGMAWIGLDSLDTYAHIHTNHVITYLIQEI